MEILTCSACFKPFNATKCIMGGGLSSKTENVYCPHCRYVHYIPALRNEQAEIKKMFNKIKKNT